uniref:Ig-like domain-containing protein n=1 Tax=Oreochromis aureus TaxID=47969 RepID=A0A668VHM2_OREAU
YFVTDSVIVIVVVKKKRPVVIVYPRDQVIQKAENTLICFINHFFPPSINIKWSKNGKNITVKNPFKKCLSNPDGTFHILFTLNFVPQKGDIYGCTVEHEALEEPLTRFWGETNFYISKF